MKHSMGLSIIEILTTLLFLGVLALLAGGSFSTAITSARSNSALTPISESISLARSAAILENTTVTICGSPDGNHCDRDWNHIVLVFTDANEDGALNNRDRLIAATTLPNTGGEIRWRAFQNRRYLQINSVGFTRHQNGSFTFCHDSGDPHHTRQLIVNRAARLRFALDRDGDGIVEDSRGNPVSCR